MIDIRSILQPKDRPLYDIAVDIRRESKRLADVAEAILNRLDASSTGKRAGDTAHEKGVFGG